MRNRFVVTAGILVLAVLITGYGLSAQEHVRTRRTADKDTVDRQHAADLARIEKIKRNLGAFKDEINRRLGTDNKTRIDDPIEPDAIDDIERLDHFHSHKKIPPREFAYINGDAVLKSEGGPSGDVIGRLAYREKVEVLAQTERIDDLKGVKAPWVLVRRSNGDEGWVFGYFIQRKEPREKRDLDSSYGETTDRLLSAPVIGTITSRFGYRVNPFTRRRESFHRGLDIAAKEGTPVKASAGGTVVLAEYLRNGYGNLVVIEHEKELSTFYGHLSEIKVAKGQKVSHGDIIGAVGRTGSATGAHLHFEVRRGGNACDPESYLR